MREVADHLWRRLTFESSYSRGAVWKLNITELRVDGNVDDRVVISSRFVNRVRGADPGSR